MSASKKIIAYINLKHVLTYLTYFMYRVSHAGVHAFDLLQLGRLRANHFETLHT